MPDLLELSIAEYRTVRIRLILALIGIGCFKGGFENLVKTMNDYVQKAMKGMRID